MISLLEFYLTGSIIAAALWTAIGILMHYADEPFEDREFYPMFGFMILFSWIALVGTLLGIVIVCTLRILKITISGIFYLVSQFAVIIYDNFKRIRHERKVYNKSKK